MRKVAKEDVKYFYYKQITIFHLFVFCIPYTSQPTKLQTFRWKDILYLLLAPLSSSNSLAAYLFAYLRTMKQLVI